MIPSRPPSFSPSLLLSLSLSLLLPFSASAATSPAAPKRPNVLFIAVDDLRNDLGAMGVAHARTPQLDAFAATARIFSHHYVQVPTCGASRTALLRGRYPSEAAHVGNGGIATTHSTWGDANLPAWFLRNGYRTYALGKITHHPGGRTGKLWHDGPEELPGAWTRSWIPQTPWNEAENIMHGYANGVPRTPGFFKPHLPFAAPKRYFDLHDPEKIPALAPAAAAKPAWPSTWHTSNEFRRNYGHAGRDPDTDPAYTREVRRAYAAATSYVDAQIGRVLDALKTLDPAGNTIVVVWSDHGLLLGEHGIWGKHCLYEHSLRSPLMIRAPGLAQPGVTSAALVETIDIFPTLADLCGLNAPGTLDGRSLRPQLDRPATPAAKPARGFWTDGQRTIRTERWRLIAARAADGSPQFELFDYANDPLETRNVATAHPDVIRDLLAQLARLPEIPAPAAKGSKKSKTTAVPSPL
jgi:iduronate 2-sulfatase